MQATGWVLIDCAIGHRLRPQKIWSIEILPRNNYTTTYLKASLSRHTKDQIINYFMTLFLTVIVECRYSSRIHFV